MKKDIGVENTQPILVSKKDAARLKEITDKIGAIKEKLDSTTNSDPKQIAELTSLYIEVKDILKENDTCNNFQNSTLINHLFSIIAKQTVKVESLFSEKEKADAILKQVQNDLAAQGELFPLFKPQKSVELKKEFALNFGGLERIEKDYAHLLHTKLSSGLTLQQQIDKVKNWFNSLHGENMGNWIKLFAYVKMVKVFTESNKEAINFRDLGNGRYCFSIKRDHKFFEHFIRRNKKSGQFAEKTKDKFLKWLYDNQNAIEFPMIINGEVWNIPTRVYEYAENVTTKELLFSIDTRILESEFKDYISINIDEINNISDQWEEIAAADNNFKKYSLNGFVDIPLKFLLTLKQIYSEGGNFTAENGFLGNAQKLTKDNLNIHLGNLKERTAKHLQSRDKAGTKKSRVLENVTRLLLETTWSIARERSWINNAPALTNGVYSFNINAGYFARKATARRLENTVKREKTS